MEALFQNISPLELKTRVESGEDIVVIDVRNEWELDVSSVPFSTHIVLHEIPERLNEIPKDKPVILLCRSGNRSQHAAIFLAHQGWDSRHLYNVEGGILRWAQDVDPSLPLDY